MQKTPPEKMKIAVGDNISLEVTRYGGGAKTPALCIPGLTRNAADFAEFAAKLADSGRDVYALSLRGRGASDYDPDLTNYRPAVYRDDVIAVLDALGVESAVFVGTSLGGITTMLANETAPARVRAAIINDVGPDLDAEGIARIAGYVGKTGEPAASLDEAAARVRAVNEVAFPDADAEFWRDFARRTYRQTDDGWRLDYDPKIADAFAVVGPAPDLWPGWTSLAQTPTLLVHGEISDLLTDPIIETMRAAHPGFDYVRVPRIGHAPFLTEPAAWAAIEAFLNNAGV